MAKLSIDALYGQKLFLYNGSICHKNKFDKSSLLESIIHPSSAIVFGYEAWTIHSKDGQSHFGFIVGENEHSITIKELSGIKQTIALTEIVSRKKQAKSLMPEATAMMLSGQDLTDLSVYLLAKEK
ncbi:MAG: dehydrogenase, partial [Saprospiraceae bacterium]